MEIFNKYHVSVGGEPFTQFLDMANGGCKAFRLRTHYQIRVQDLVRPQSLKCDEEIINMLSAIIELEK